MISLPFLELKMYESLEVFLLKIRKFLFLRYLSKMLNYTHSLHLSDVSQVSCIAS